MKYSDGRNAVLFRVGHRIMGIRWGDRLFRSGVFLMASLVLLLTLLIAFELYRNSQITIGRFGLSFIWGKTWDPVAEIFGAWPFLYGTLVTSALALLIAVPVGLGAAIFLAELAPRRVSDGAAFLIELLAAIPSVIYGLIGIFILVPWIRTTLQPFLSRWFGFLPIFSGPAYGVGFLAAGIVLAVMIVPFITSVSREVLLAVPRSQREAALSLGATRWEMVRVAVLPYARSGIAGSIFLALARALGETMAVTMVIGNRPDVSLSLFAPGYTMAAVIANEFTEATADAYVHALTEIGLVLFGVTILVNAVARVLVAGVAKRVEIRE
jgi:phosphate transport system permease protein